MEMEKHDGVVKLTAANVEAVFNACAREGGRLVQGIVHTFAFDPEVLERRRADIEQMLDGLPGEFHEDIGGGWAFLNACMDRDGRQWADLHLTMEKLVTLGLAIGRVRFPMPRDWWKSLPGGMPYFVVARKEEGNR